MPVTPRPAATLILMRDSHQPQGGTEVLMVKRPLSASFAPGALVFPGGALESMDNSESTHRFSAPLTEKMAGEALNFGDSPGEALAYYWAAIRETFEETLVLLAHQKEATEIQSPASNGGLMTEGMGTGISEEDLAMDLEEARTRLLSGKMEFPQWLDSLGLTPSLENLVPLSHWVTPEASPIRFDTRFFLAKAPGHARVSLDIGELETHCWINPKSAIDKATRSEVHLMRPTKSNLEILADYNQTSQALSDLDNRGNDKGDDGGNNGGNDAGIEKQGECKVGFV